MKLYYTPGSPFARIVRVLLRELGVACEEVEIIGFPPQASYFAVNPLGQVPALETPDGLRFPTRLIIDHLMAGPMPAGASVAPAIRREPNFWRDEQVLTVLLAMGDALAAAKYQQWAGLGPVGDNLIGYNPAERNLRRAMETLDWLELAAGPGGFLPGGLSVQDIALACIILWTEARGGIEWRGRKKIEAIVDGCATRPSFLATRPQPWP